MEIKLTSMHFGCVYRITKPPGGDASDIFGASSPTTTPPATPRKVKNYLASNIFSADRGDAQPKTRQRQDADSFNRLFGAKDAPDGGSPVKVKNYQKSNVLMSDAPATNGHVNGKNGHANGHAEAKNGHASPNGSVNGHGSDSGVGSGSVTPNGDAEPKTSNLTDQFSNNNMQYQNCFLWKNNFSNYKLDYFYY